MSAQDVLLFIGFFACIVAAGFAVTAAVYFARSDIRGVYADLTGKSRQAEISGGEGIGAARFGRSRGGLLGKKLEWRGGIARGAIGERDEEASTAHTSVLAIGEDGTESVSPASSEEPTATVSDLAPDMHIGCDDADGATATVATPLEEGLTATAVSEGAVDADMTVSQVEDELSTVVAGVQDRASARDRAVRQRVANIVQEDRIAQADAPNARDPIELSIRNIDVSVHSELEIGIGGGVVKR